MLMRLTRRHFALLPLFTLACRKHVAAVWQWTQAPGGTWRYSRRDSSGTLVYAVIAPSSQEQGTWYTQAWEDHGPGSLLGLHYESLDAAQKAVERHFGGKR